MNSIQIHDPDFTERIEADFVVALKATNGKFDLFVEAFTRKNGKAYLRHTSDVREAIRFPEFQAEEVAHQLEEYRCTGRVERVSADGCSREVVEHGAPASILPSPEPSADDQSMAETLKAGTIVTLITGGPNMTVKASISEATGTFVRCQHFEGTRLIEDDYAAKTLKVVFAHVERVSREGPEREVGTPEAGYELPLPQQSEDDDGMAAILKLGALVRLKTGGPDMAIEEIITGTTGRSDQFYLCQFLDGTEPASCYFFA